MKYNSGKLAAQLLAVIVVMSSSLTIHANSPELEQVKDVELAENNDKSDVVRVILPTDAVGIFDFILDPQGLINKTNGAAYEGNSFEENATLFFKRTDGGVQENYSSTSDAVKVTNKGSTSVNVIVTASITDPSADGFVMTDDREFADDTRPSLYLALIDGETTVPIMVDEKASLMAEIPAVSEGSDDEGNIYSFQLTGAANGKGDWSRLKEIELDVTVTWNIISNEEERSQDDISEVLTQQGEEGIQKYDSQQEQAVPASHFGNEMPVSNISGSDVLSPSDIRD